MTSSGDAMSLVQPGQSGSNFAQQGTVDWVAVSQTTFSASVAILSRLSRAGLQPLTVAIAQALSINIPIGIHGEKQLNNAMSGLKAFGSFGDVIFFGFGVQHVLRVLVQTSQGASSVALVASLTEGHSTMYTAYVLYEMAKLMKSPADLTSSFAQWERYAEVCAGLFSTSMFGVKIAQISRLCGFTRNAQIRSKVNAAHAEEMARALCAIGTVQTGQCESIDVVGGISCCWAVVFCDLLLGLRVQVLRSDGTLVFASQAAIGDKPQIRFLVGIGNNADAIICTGRIITLKSEEFVSRWHRNVDLSYAAVTGRLDWKTMICDSFDNVADILTIEGRGTRPFARLFSAAAVFYCHGRLASRYRQPEDFIQQAVLSIPELRPVHGILLQEAKTPIDLGSAAVKYRTALRDLGYIQNGADSLACETIIVLAFLLGETFLDDSLQPTTSGIRHLFVKLSKASLVAKERTNDETTLDLAKLDSHKFKGTNYVAEQAAERLVPGNPYQKKIMMSVAYNVAFSVRKRLNTTTVTL